MEHFYIFRRSDRLVISTPALQPSVSQQQQKKNNKSKQHKDDINSNNNNTITA
jgi:hypothetical protein